jgi:SM-20-related protein
MQHHRRYHKKHNKLITDSRLDTIADALVDQGFIVLTQALDEEVIAGLYADVRAMQTAAFTAAGTGRQNLQQHDLRVRSDKISWLQANSQATRSYLDFAGQLRHGLNQRLFFGLFDYECHYARYEPGDFYAKHRDAFAGRSNRILSSVLYLNRDWPPDAGGELLLYAEDETTLLYRVKPEYNTLVLFLSERFPHEVLPAQRQRLSLTGWFRIREDTPLAGKI